MIARLFEADRAYLTCCRTLSRRTTLKMRNTEDRLLTLLEVTQMSTIARITITKSSLFLRNHTAMHHHAMEAMGKQATLVTQICIIARITITVSKLVLHGHTIIHHSPKAA